MSLDKIRKEMLSGKMYNDLNPALVKAREDAILLSNAYNDTYGKPQKERIEVLKKLVNEVADDAHFEPGFRCEFGFHIKIGKHFYANFDCVMLDGASIVIGDNVLIGPRVGMYTSNHAINPEERRAGGCYGKPIVIEDDVWIGAGVNILQGVTIKKGSIIGAGSVVTKDIPENVIAVGNPCRILRSINESDKTTFLNEK